MWIWEALVVFAGGVAGGQSVLAGAWLDLPGFGVRSGFWGTHFLDSRLYAMGNDDVAVAIVAAFWDFYTTVIAICAVGLARVVTYVWRRTMG
jgi:hypothetical protein